MKLRISLHTRLLLLVSIVIIFMFIAGIIYHYQQERDEYEHNLAMHMQLQADLLAASIAQAMWDFNQDYIESALTGALREQEIIQIQVLDTKSQTIAQKTAPQQESFTSTNLHIHSAIHYALAGENHALGQVELIVSQSLVKLKLHRYFRVMAFQAFIFLSLLLLLLHGILRYLLRPIESITHTMQELSKGKTDLSIPSQKRYDEIGEMARAIEVFKNTALRADALEEEVKRRQELHEELHKAKEKAEELNTAKSLFLANMSHEIRTPMNGILGMAHLLQDDNPVELQKEYIKTIHHSAKNLLLLLNDILDMSKIEAKELILEHAPFEASVSFQETINLFRPLAHNRGTELSTFISPNFPPKIWGDGGRFNQILANLIGNAVKFTDQGQIKARLHYHATHSTLFCEVEDTGIGIPAHMRGVLFEKFTQADATISRKYGGTGLGLTITRQLITLMGGEIDYESEPGKGSRFWFSLPAIPLADTSPAQSRVQLDIACLAQIPVASARLLIAEDHPVNQLFLMKLLKKYGFEHIELAENGNQALAKLEAASYDAVFMDCRMPEKDGYETTRIIREKNIKSSNDTHILIIAMTANALAGDKEKCVQIGMDEYINKPIDPEKLQRLLRQWFIFSDSIPNAPQDNAVTKPLIDLRPLQTVTSSKEEQAELLTLFFRKADEQISALKHARRTDEFDQRREAAHALKGAALNLGMARLVEPCQKMEASSALSYQDISVLLEQISTELLALQTYFQEQGIL